MIYEEEGLWELCRGNYTQNATVHNKQPPSWIKRVLLHYAEFFWLKVSERFLGLLFLVWVKIIPTDGIKMSNAHKKIMIFFWLSNLWWTTRRSFTIPFKSSLQYLPARFLRRLLQKNHIQTIKLHQKYSIRPFPTKTTLQVVSYKPLNYSYMYRYDDTFILYTILKITKCSR